MIPRLCPGLLLCLSLPFLAPTATHASARLKTRLEAPATIWIGQRLNLDITLYASGAFSGVPRFGLPDNADLLILDDDSRPLLGAARIDGTDYLSKQYSLAVFPLRAGPLVIPAFTVEFTYHDAKRRQRTVTFSTSARRLVVQPVPGAAPSQPLLTTPRLRVDDRWSPAPGKARVGDAFTRTVTVTAEDLPGMALPPLKPTHPDGVALYPETPRISTDTERGAFLGRRQERYTYIFEQPGHYRLPAIALQWWNPGREVLQTVQLQAVQFEVAPNPLLQSHRPDSAPGSIIATAWLPLLMLAGLIPILWYGQKRRRHRHQTGPTETRLFKRFRQAATANDPAGSMRALMDWLDAGQTPHGCTTLKAFLQSANDPELSARIAQLEQHLYGRRQTESWSGRPLYRAVKRVRSRNRRGWQRHRSACRYCLQALNPPGA